jgi:hypothetical protein
MPGQQQTGSLDTSAPAWKATFGFTKSRKRRKMKKLLEDLNNQTSVHHSVRKHTKHKSEVEIATPTIENRPSGFCCQQKETV